jgi:Zn-dependent peptidase ImmA (M78 family)
MSAKRAKLAAELILNDRWDRKLPVDVFSIVENLKIGLMEIIDKDTIYSGAYSPNYHANDGRPTILINPAEPYTRQRFTIAHELGHHVLHGKQSFRDPLHQVPGTDYRETEANTFAANLLMPEFYFRYYVESGKYFVSALASIFGVSPSAISVRLKDLGYYE